MKNPRWKPTSGDNKITRFRRFANSNVLIYKSPKFPCSPSSYERKISNDDTVHVAEFTSTYRTSWSRSYLSQMPFQQVPAERKNVMYCKYPSFIQYQMEVMQVQNGRREIEFSNNTSFKMLNEKKKEIKCKHSSMAFTFKLFHIQIKIEKTHCRVSRIY